MQAKAVIIGAGFAGAACAYFLGRMGVRDVVLLEREAQAGLHASGKNAGMARQFTPVADVLPLAAEGTRFLYTPPPEVADRPLITPVGSIILCDDTAPYSELLDTAHRCDIAATLIRPSEWASRLPWLPAKLAPHGVWTPTDGVVDIHRFLSGLLRGAQQYDVQYTPHAQVTSIARHGNQHVVRTAHGEWDTNIVVNAAGAWVNEVAAMVHLSTPRFQPLRRHLFATQALPAIDPASPFVWDDCHGWYCRPEGGGLIFSACDETPAMPDDAAIDPAVELRLRRLLAAHCPKLADVPIARTWSGLRTFSPSRRFVTGWDAACPSFFWLAGLGGHGVTCAAAVGRRAAEQIHQRLL